MVSKQRYLVLHDYGMGGLRWWIHARSAREVLETFAEVEVIDTAAAISQAEERHPEEIDIDASVMPPGLDELRATRDSQRGVPGFGALADREVVYLRQNWDGDDPATYLVEIGRDGRRIRQVETSEDGVATKTDAADWPFNPPLVDLFDPHLRDQEIDRDEFERAWAGAQWENGR
ncbi:hypothetical protein [Kutzneria sp. CA-103260]|uniref:hypothetical protein n=1 Tax=Kutzneria sp. CA-103260 TaxID=2802641 RepID=UPI001BA7C2CB|nr:hypothetical protein [Kutzneria sp. CA-103260]QUQ64072.1 hypothetical protein JJ691_17920 [Kutzneria sp. CA-103260]